MSREALHFDIDPRAIVRYGLPAYKRYQLRGGSYLIRRIRKFANRHRRSQLVQHEDYIRLGVFQDTETYRFLAELEACDLDFRATARYRDFAARIAGGEVIRLRSKRVVLTDVAGLDEYCREYVRLLESMRESGYLSAGEKDRITIMVDADGSIMKETKGRHRLAAAQIVGVPSVPVRVSHVHAAWTRAQQNGSGQAPDSPALAVSSIERALASVRVDRAVRREDASASGSEGSPARRAAP